MNKNIDLTEILKGCEGMTFYSSVLGYVILKQIDNNTNYPIIVQKITGNNYIKNFTKDGILYKLGNDEECVFFPSKDQRDWNKFERPIPVDTPMMCSSDNTEWYLRYYRKCIDGRHYVTINGDKSNENSNMNGFTKVIPFDKFDPNDIEESLKYNIQK